MAGTAGAAGRGGAEGSRHRAQAAPAVWVPTPRDQRDANTLDLLGDPSVEEVRLVSRPESASAARRLTVSVLRLWSLPHLADVCELLVSELVGNAVRHTGARTFGLRMPRRRGWVRVEVRDPSRALPCLLPVRELDTSGRGLFLVDKLSDRWGVDLLPRGKTTWFELRATDR
ncbi:ATP-binding protein [Streptomyces sp. SID5468]|nr:ATP-binding protein [Streptomyces sp. SID5468]